MAQVKKNYSTSVRISVVTTTIPERYDKVPSGTDHRTVAKIELEASSLEQLIDSLQKHLALVKE